MPPVLTPQRSPRPNNPLQEILAKEGELQKRGVSICAPSTLPPEEELYDKPGTRRGGRGGRCAARACACACAHRVCIRGKGWVPAPGRGALTSTQLPGPRRAARLLAAGTTTATTTFSSGGAWPAGAAGGTATAGGAAAAAAGRLAAATAIMTGAATAARATAATAAAAAAAGRSAAGAGTLTVPPGAAAAAAGGATLAAAGATAAAAGAGMAAGASGERSAARPLPTVSALRRAVHGVSTPFKERPHTYVLLIQACAFDCCSPLPTRAILSCRPCTLPPT